ncbi:hypothetical protein PRZ48_003508 [Zasmidium cellare]|uniref:Uncharacterized protein n=1 Tax=Zasmidium cellare TaxID=395010 RepID=A0ABR0EWT2_ZASCE|nr:hypothetical protein PRZ48_003508 [Zasmidium cellare]
MATRLRLPTLAIAALSLGLNVAILGCAGRTLAVFMEQRYTSTWFMPVWSSHFDTRELWALIWTSAVVLILNLVLMAGLFIASRFAFYTTIPSLILQVLLLALALYAVFVAGPKQRGMRLDEEKEDHELGSVRQLSVEGKSAVDSVGIVSAGGGRGKFS